MKNWDAEARETTMSRQLREHRGHPAPPNLQSQPIYSSGKKIPYLWSAQNKGEDIFSEITDPSKHKDIRVQCIAERRERSKLPVQRSQTFKNTLQSFGICKSGR